MKRLSVARTAFILALVCSLSIAASAFAEPWKFGVMSDTQWIGADDGRNPGTCAVDIVKALNKQFIGQGVKFVVQMGDLVDTTGSTTMSITNTEDVRAVLAQELYNAGIGFFPHRGNHDSQPFAGTEFKRIYPQTVTGIMNATPANAFTVPNPDAAVQPFPAVSGLPFYMGANFSSPAATTTNGLDWTGLSYSFDFNNARFVLLDQFSAPNAGANQNPSPNAIDLQQSWIDSMLSGRAASTHAFVFSHKGLITENHVDTLFGSDPSKDPAGQDAFITSLYNNGVRYYMQGHDHMHDRSLVSVTTGTPTDGVSPRVQNILCASDSSKFYTPGFPSNDDKYNVPAFGHGRQAQISQELHTVGFYIVTVDGPRVTVDYYSAVPSNVAPAGCAANSPNCEYLIPTTPALNFVKAETFGYSLNGREFQVCQAGKADCDSSYTQVVDSYNGTTAKILSGTNGSTAMDYDNRSFIKTVDTGWTDGTVSTPKSDGDTASNILTLWGMSDLYAASTETYTLSMNYDPSKSRPEHLGEGMFGLATKDEQGNWINAVSKNIGGEKKFVMGPWKEDYELGTYGVDPDKKTAWAVINYTADFAIARFNR